MRLDAWHVTWFAYGALLVTLCAWGLFAPWTASGRPAWMALAILPLLAALPGLKRRSTYTAAWLSLLVVGYIVAALVEVVALPERRGWAGGALAGAMLLFASLLKVSHPERRE